ncbi:MAG: efflux RND transporter periplasmic adaptor subunit [Proteobacteria bacterium]|nr:efflux RND transporter periplasmic adaptor subunit [Pseudomonadota bacterium]
MSRLPLLLALMLGACGETEVGHGHAHGPDGSHADPSEDDGTTLAVTRWADGHEFFAEFDGPVAGHAVGYAAHVTQLTGFAAATTGSLQLRFEQDGFAVESHTDPKVARPGVFIGELTGPAKPGKYALIASYTDGETRAEWRIDDVVVGQGRAPQVEAEPEGEVGFLKESQWQVPFAVQAASVQPLSPVLAVAATVRSAPSSTAVVAAPADGLVAWAGDLPVPGRRVKRGERLATWLPVGESADYAKRQADLASAQVALDLAEKELSRIEELHGNDLVSERRLEEARGAEQSARAGLVSGERRLRALTTSGSGAVPVVSPADGLIVHVGPAHGEAVSAGDSLVRVASGSAVLLEGHVHERTAGELGNVASLSVHRGDWDEPRDLLSAGGRLLTDVLVFDEHTLSAPVAVLVENDVGLGTGDLVELQIGVGEPTPRLTIPRSAVVEINGQDIVFVQKTGESFARRRVTLGEADPTLVEVLTGIEAGEKVVTTGGYDIHVAALSGTLESHAH